MSYSISFLWNSLLLTLPILLFLGMKRIFRRHLTIKSRAFSWYLFFLLLSLPLLPVSWQQGAVKKISSIGNRFIGIFPIDEFFLGNRLFEKLDTIQRHFQVQNGLEQLNPTLTNTSPLNIDRKIVDFSLSIERSSAFPFSRILSLVWLAGIMVVLTLILLVLFRMKSLKRRAIPVTASQEPELSSLFEKCRQELHLEKPVSLYRSCELSSPVSYGLFYPKVLIPEDLDITFSEKEVHYIFLHELAHHKRKDTLLNILRCLLQTIYWFHPAVWYGFRKLPTDREMACDNLVMETIGPESSLEYGQTILLYAGKRFSASFSLVSGIGGSHSQLKERIYQIVNYKASAFSQRLKSFLILFLVLLFILTGSPLLSAQIFALEAYPERHAQNNDVSTDYQTGSTIHSANDISGQGSSDSVVTEDLSSYFEGMDGTFVLYDMNQNFYNVYNENQSRERFSPASTYKIYSGLFALEEQILTPSENQMAWDGTSWPFDTWNQNQDLTSAMQNSVNWYFQALDQKLGMKKLASYYKKINYGNADLSGGIKEYWGESSLKISPMEQVKLLASLNQNKWNFDDKNIQAIKDAMLISSQNGCSLYGKTGTGRINEHDINGWFVGMVENQKKTWCFAVHIKGKEDAGGVQASSIALKILKAKGIYWK